MSWRARVFPALQMKWGFAMRIFMLASTACALVIAAPAGAATYNFNVIYGGNNNAVLAGGSDDPLSTVLNAGDTFTYRLTAAGTGEWTTLAAGSIFPFFSLNVTPSGTRTVDFTLDLNNNGGSIFNYAENGATNQFVHLGTNTVAFGAGLVWDEYELTATILAGSDPATAIGLLPWPGLGPENYSPSFISFSGAIPEPGTWAMLILGFGLAGTGLRASRTRVRFA